MLMKNLSTRTGLINGSRGIVVGFDATRKGFPRVLFSNGEERTMDFSKWSVNVGGQEVASRTQIPLKLAWALSIHKCQGSTITRAQMSLSRVFEYGQAYVALSRVSSLEGLRLLDFSARAVKVHPEVLQFYSTFSTNTTRIETIILSAYADRSTRKFTENFHSCVAKFTSEVFPYAVDYAASGRSKCRNCNTLIDKDVLRMGRVAKSSTFGHYTQWCHLGCYFSRKPNGPTETGSIQGFEQLKPEDQEMLMKKYKMKKTPLMFANLIRHGDKSVMDEPQMQTHVEIKPLEDEETNGKEHVQPVFFTPNVLLKEEKKEVEQFEFLDEIVPPPKKPKVTSTPDDSAREEEARRKAEERELKLEMLRKKREMQEKEEEERKRKREVETQQSVPFDTSRSLALEMFSSWKKNVYQQTKTDTQEPKKSEPEVKKSPKKKKSKKEEEDIEEEKEESTKKKQTPKKKQKTESPKKKKKEQEDDSPVVVKKKRKSKIVLEEDVEPIELSD